MSHQLHEFLIAEDLDQLLDAWRKLGSLDADDTATVRSVLARWETPQAVSNLLFHPDLIPEDIRLDALFRGLAEQRVAYYVLAAVVGLQALDPTRLSAEERKRVAAELWDVMAQTTDVLAHRASVSFRGFVTDTDAPSVLMLLLHPDKTVRHNARAWLFSTFKDRGPEALAAAAQQTGLNEEVRRQVSDEFTEFVTNPPTGFKSPEFPLYAYIPNLRDVVDRG